MQDIIQILPTNIANQIAAGEVVQRPSSVVKELIENAIDAKATHIQLIIKDAGKTLIQVIDNGFGMSEKDALTSFLPHATSKIRKSQDLFNLNTMGFRGEALSSISSISHVQMKTKQEASELGTILEIEGGEVKNKSSVSCEKGTSISVKNLFFNTPARRNFLKSDSSENSHILDEFIRTAIINNDISFTYYNNDKLVYKLEKEGTKKRIIDLFGKSFNERLLPINEELEQVKITGYVLKAEYSKRNRGEQFFFVNNRFMRNPYLANSVDRAYQGLIAEKTYPSFFIHIEVPPKNIDVNIHPTKTEIKFLDEKLIYAILNAAVKKSLGQFTLMTQIDFDRDRSFDVAPLKQGQMPLMPKTNFDSNFNPFNSTKEKSFNSKESKNITQALFKEDNNSFGDRVNVFELENRLDDSNKSIEKFVEIIQFQNKYIISKTKNSIIIIHQERASQRILFEQFLSSRYDDITFQQLLFPYNHFFSTPYTKKLLELLPEVREYGFSIEYKSDGSFDILGVPNNLSSEESQILLEELLYEISDDNTNPSTSKQYKIALSMCKRLCIKEGRELQYEEIWGLVGQLFSSQNCELSPFGKKILHKIDIDNLDNIFNSR